MSRFARDWAWTLPVPPPQKLVILALAERADDSGTCWPSLTHLTEMTGLVRSTVALALIGLEDAHLVVRDRGGSGKSTRYRLLIEGPGVALGSPRVARNGEGNTHGDGLGSERGSSPGGPVGGPFAGPVVSPGDGLVRGTVVRQTDRGSPADGPGSPADGLTVVREPDPNRQLNRHRTESEPSVCGDDTAHRPKPTTDRRRRVTPIPRDWRPDERVFAWAATRGMTRDWVEAQLDEFLVYWTDTGEARKSWDATFINRLQALQASQPNDQAHEPEPRLADKDYSIGATPLDQIPWLKPASVP